MKNFKITLFVILFCPLTVLADVWQGLAPQSPRFCQLVQQLTAQTDLESANTVFTEMPAYRHSKPMAKPLTNFQVVSYWQGEPVMVSCKVKSADHLRAVYGDNAAGKQRFCFDVSRDILASVISELSITNPKAADRAKQFNIKKEEPYITGRSYLQDFQLAYVDHSQVLQINTPSLLTPWENIWFSVLPDKIRGQLYCHLPTREYLNALATDRLKPDWVATTADDAATSVNH